MYKKKKKNIQVQEIFKNTHRPESPVCHRQQMNKKKKVSEKKRFE